MTLISGWSGEGRARVGGAARLVAGSPARRCARPRARGTPRGETVVPAADDDRVVDVRSHGPHVCPSPGACPLRAGALAGKAPPAGAHHAPSLNGQSTSSARGSFTFAHVVRVECPELPVGRAPRARRPCSGVQEERWGGEAGVEEAAARPSTGDPRRRGLRHHAAGPRRDQDPGHRRAVRGVPRPDPLLLRVEGPAPGRGAHGRERPLLPGDVARAPADAVGEGPV